MTYVFVSVFDVTALGSLVEKRVQADQEQHVDHQQRDDPDHDDNHYLNQCVQVLVPSHLTSKHTWWLTGQLALIIFRLT